MKRDLRSRQRLARPLASKPDGVSSFTNQQRDRTEPSWTCSARGSTLQSSSEGRSEASPHTSHSGRSPLKVRMYRHMSRYFRYSHLPFREVPIEGTTSGGDPPRTGGPHTSHSGRSPLKDPGRAGGGLQQHRSHLPFREVPIEGRAPWRVPPRLYPLTPPIPGGPH